MRAVFIACVLLLVTWHNVQGCQQGQKVGAKMQYFSSAGNKLHDEEYSTFTATVPSGGTTFHLSCLNGGLHKVESVSIVMHINPVVDFSISFKYNSAPITRRVATAQQVDGETVNYFNEQLLVERNGNVFNVGAGADFVVFKFPINDQQSQHELGQLIFELNNDIQLFELEFYANTVADGFSNIDKSAKTNSLLTLLAGSAEAGSDIEFASALTRRTDFFIQRAFTPAPVKISLDNTDVTKNSFEICLYFEATGNPRAVLLSFQVEHENNEKSETANYRPLVNHEFYTIDKDANGNTRIKATGATSEPLCIKAWPAIFPDDKITKIFITFDNEGQVFAGFNNVALQLREVLVHGLKFTDMRPYELNRIEPPTGCRLYVNGYTRIEFSPEGLFQEPEGYFGIVHYVNGKRFEHQQMVEGEEFEVRKRGVSVLCPPQNRKRSINEEEICPDFTEPPQGGCNESDKKKREASEAKFFGDVAVEFTLQNTGNLVFQIMFLSDDFGVRSIRMPDLDYNIVFGLKMNPTLPNSVVANKPISFNTQIAPHQDYSQLPEALVVPPLVAPFEIRLGSKTLCTTTSVGSSSISASASCDVTFTEVVGNEQEVDYIFNSNKVASNIDSFQEEKDIKVLLDATLEFAEPSEMQIFNFGDIAGKGVITGEDIVTISGGQFSNSMSLTFRGEDQSIIDTITINGNDFDDINEHMEFEFEFDPNPNDAGQKILLQSSSHQEAYVDVPASSRNFIVKRNSNVDVSHPSSIVVGEAAPNLKISISGSKFHPPQGTVSTSACLSQPTLTIEEDSSIASCPMQFNTINAAGSLSVQYNGDQYNGEDGYYTGSNIELHYPTTSRLEISPHYNLNLNIDAVVENPNADPKTHPIGSFVIEDLTGGTPSTLCTTSLQPKTTISAGSISTCSPPAFPDKATIKLRGTYYPSSVSFGKFIQSETVIYNLLMGKQAPTIFLASGERSFGSEDPSAHFVFRIDEQSVEYTLQEAGEWTYPQNSVFKNCVTTKLTFECDLWFPVEDEGNDRTFTITWTPSQSDPGFRTTTFMETFTIKKSAKANTQGLATIEQIGKIINVVLRIAEKEQEKQGEIGKKRGFEAVMLGTGGPADIPSGTVVIKIVQGTVSKTVCTTQLNTAGEATCQFEFDDPGLWSVQIEYGGDQTFASAVEIVPVSVPTDCTVVTKTEPEGQAPVNTPVELKFEVNCGSVENPAGNVTVTLGEDILCDEIIIVPSQQNTFQGVSLKTCITSFAESGDFDNINVHYTGDSLHNAALTTVGYKVVERVQQLKLEIADDKGADKLIFNDGDDVHLTLSFDITEKLVDTIFFIKFSLGNQQLTVNAQAPANSKTITLAHKFTIKSVGPHVVSATLLSTSTKNVEIFIINNKVFAYPANPVKVEQHGIKEASSKVELAVTWKDAELAKTCCNWKVVVSHNNVVAHEELVDTSAKTGQQDIESIITLNRQAFSSASPKIKVELKETTATETTVGFVELTIHFCSVEFCVDCSSSQFGCAKCLKEKEKLFVALGGTSCVDQCPSDQTVLAEKFCSCKKVLKITESGSPTCVDQCADKEFVGKINFMTSVVDECQACSPECSKCTAPGTSVAVCTCNEELGFEDVDGTCGKPVATLGSQANGIIEGEENEQETENENEENEEEEEEGEEGSNVTITAEGFESSTTPPFSAEDALKCSEKIPNGVICNGKCRAPAACSSQDVSVVVSVVKENIPIQIPTNDGSDIAITFSSSSGQAAVIVRYENQESVINSGITVTDDQGQPDADQQIVSGIISARIVQGNEFGDGNLDSPAYIVLTAFLPRSQVDSGNLQTGIFDGVNWSFAAIRISRIFESNKREIEDDPIVQVQCVAEVEHFTSFAVLLGGSGGGGSSSGSGDGTAYVVQWLSLAALCVAIVIVAVVIAVFHLQHLHQKRQANKNLSRLQTAVSDAK